MKFSVLLSAVFAAAAIASAIPNPEAAPASDIKKRNCYTSKCGENCEEGYTAKNILYCNHRFGIVRKVCCR